MENAPSITNDRLTPIPTVFREDVEQDVDLTVQTQLAKAGITEETLAEALDNAQAVMRPVENEADLRALQDVLTPIVRLRTSIVRICKKGREHANMVSRAWIAAEKHHVAEVLKVEDLLTAYKDEWNAAKEREKAAEEAEARKVIQDRYAVLEGIGMVRKVATADFPERYVIGMYAAPLEVIDTADAPTWDAIVEKAASIANAQRKVEEEKREREEADAKTRKEEAERIEAQRKEQERKERDLAEREARLNAAEVAAVPEAAAPVVEVIAPLEPPIPMDPAEPTMAQNLTWALRYLKHESVLWREKGEARPMLEYIIELIAKRHGLTLQE